MSKHTKGPLRWTVDDRKGGYLIRHDDGSVYGEGCEEVGIVYEKNNARLVAAAPELLEALKLVASNHACEQYQVYDAEGNERCAVCAAIAKATGEAA